MANVTKLKRDEMIKFLEELKNTHTDDSSIRAFNEIENALTEKKFGLVFEEHTEEVDERLLNEIPIFCADESRKICKDKNLPYNFIIEGDNLQALYLLEKTHRGRIDCIYIDPPYNTGARDWKYNNDYVDSNDNYRHSKWLSMMKTRLLVAKRLLNPIDSVLICTIDEKEYYHLGCLLEELFPNAKIQMISSVTNVKGVARESEFSRVNEYIYIVQIGKCAVKKLTLTKEWLGNVKNSGRNKLRLGSMLRSGSNSERRHSPGCFYPIYFTKNGNFIKTGDSLGLNVSRETVEVPKDQIVIWPIHKDGSEGVWQYSKSSFDKLYEKGFVYFGKLKNGKIGISYAPRGVRQKITEGLFKISGYNEDGSAIIDDSNYESSFIPGNQWAISSHNSTEYGSKLLKEILGEKRFTYPKSLYAVHDVIKFFVSDKPNAVIVDFFAGSGTTLHAVNLLNLEDNGKRTCIMVTNNEVSEAEANNLRDRGFMPGDEEWEKLGIAKYVTWPRTYCSINGIDIKNKKLKGKYLGTNAKMSNGFKCNVKYFKCDWTPRKPEDYLLSNVLCLHIKEMIELENAIEIDNDKNVIIFNRDDFRNYILDNKKYEKIENIWVNQNVVFDSEELKKMLKKGFKYIPREYFGQELKEAAE